MDHEQARSLMRAQFEDGPLPPHQAEALRIHQRKCADCRQFYDQLVRVETEMGAGHAVPPAQLERMMAMGPPKPAQEQARKIRPIVPIVSVLLAAAASISLFVLAPPEDYVGVRGSRPAGQPAWISIYQARSQRVTPVKDRIDKKSALLFAYSNLETSPYRYLLIAGVDAKGRAHWYHPAYQSEKDDPKSIPITVSEADKELLERVYAEHAPGALKVCGVFTKEPLSVKTVDQKLEKEGIWPKEDALLDCHDLEVQ